MQHQNTSLFPGLQECLRALLSKFGHLPFIHHDFNPSDKGSIIKAEFVVAHGNGQLGSAKSASVQIFSGTLLDPKTGKGKLSDQAYLRRGKINVSSNGEKNTRYEIMIRIEPEFGIPGAFIIKNFQKHKFFLQSAFLQTPDNQIIQFECCSWVYPTEKTKTHRTFFANNICLPNQTPESLVRLRKEELVCLRGDGREERKEWDRIYDYDYYNDLGNPDKGPEHIRPILGGSESHPYPRRIRTGRLPSNADPSTESRPDNMINLDVYVPSDERLNPKKLTELISHSIQAAAQFLIPEAESLVQQDSSNFESFDEVHNMFSGNRSQIEEEWVTAKLKNILPADLLKEVTDLATKNPKFPSPQIIAENELAWKSDEEFARQMLAGTNPARIQSLEMFPPESKNGSVSSIKQSDIEHNLDGITVAEALNSWRILILDHHDYLMPFLPRITNTNGICIYASRTLLFLRSDETLKPIAIELSFPNSDGGDEINRVFLPASKGEAAALWQFAKAHVVVNDSVYHQLISHWLHTHAVAEPFIIATHRQLSEMHPIHWLLHPHFKDTMHVNALARSMLINSGGILEKTLFTAEISMDITAELYKDWRLDEQALPVDLLKRQLRSSYLNQFIKDEKTSRKVTLGIFQFPIFSRSYFRGMALEDSDSNNPTGIQLLFQDYPYGVDGLEIWTAIKTWVADFCSLFYKDDSSVVSDEEIQAWWSEIRNVGHGDKCNEQWWSQMTNVSNLIEALTTIIWIASALHASVNFGQYAYAGHPLNRPTKCRKFIPWEGTFEYAEFLTNPDAYFLKMMPGKLEMTLSMALVIVLSRHASDEVYLGQRSSSVWINSEEIKQKFDKFNKELGEIGKRITDRNNNPKLKNRRGPANIPYELLYPDRSNIESRGGITGKGVPNSISI